MEKGTREGLAQRQASKRVVIPKLCVESETTEDEEDKKKEKKKRKQNRTASKASSYEAILQTNMTAALSSNRSGSGRRASEKRARTPSPSSGSESDSLCARSELQKALKEKRTWRQKARDLEAQNQLLIQQVSTLTRCLEAKVFKLDSRPSCRCSQGVSMGKKTSSLTTDQEPGTSETQRSSYISGTNNDVPEDDVTSLPPPELACLTEDKPDFSYMGDGTFHLQKGFCVTNTQAAKILGNKKGTLVCKDTAQALWSSSVLATRSVSGNVAPKKRALGELPKQQLTPEKVDVVAATVQHWGQTKNVDVSEVLRNVPKHLTEKIQDVAKAMKKL